VKDIFKIVICLFIASIAFPAVACTRNEKKADETSVVDIEPEILITGDVPPWINDFPPEDSIWGVGAARMSSVSMAMTTAEARARVAIASQLANKIDIVITEYRNAAGNESTDYTVMYETVTRQVTSMNLSGARAIQRWQGEDGTMWYLVEMKKADARNSLAEMLENQTAEFSQFRPRNALQLLDAQLARNVRPQIVD